MITLPFDLISMFYSTSFPRDAEPTCFWEHAFRGWCCPLAHLSTEWTGRWSNPFVFEIVPRCGKNGPFSETYLSSGWVGIGWYSFIANYRKLSACLLSTMSWYVLRLVWSTKGLLRWRTSRPTLIFVANHPFPFNFHDTIAIYVAITVKEGQFVKRNWTNPGGLWTPRMGHWLD